MWGVGGGSCQICGSEDSRTVSGLCFVVNEVTPSFFYSVNTYFRERTFHVFYFHFSFASLSHDSGEYIIYDDI